MSSFQFKTLYNMGKARGASSLCEYNRRSKVSKPFFDYMWTYFSVSHALANPISALWFPYRQNIISG